MVNLFPILFLSQLGHTMLRIILGLIFFYLGTTHFGKQRKPFVQALNTGFPFLGRASKYIVLKYAIAEMVIGLMFVGGVFTQAAAIVGMIISLKMLIFRNTFVYPVVPSSLFWLMAFAASASLLFTGAGAFAFDFPI